MTPTTTPPQPTVINHNYNHKMVSLTLATLRNLLNNAIYYLFVYFVLMVTVYCIYFAITETLFNLWYMPRVYKVMVPCVVAATGAVFRWCERQGNERG
jgi:hypothetical protein